MLNEAFKDGVEIIEVIEKNNFEAYFVGGCVRDYLLHRPIGDIDIATSANPKQIQQIFDKVIPVGIEHGTVIVRFNNQSFEVTTYRLDGNYSDQRHPDQVSFVTDIEADLKRRDFTINALAMDKNGNIIDPFNGQNDLYSNIIKTVGNGYERFMEDPLRLIRALRFVSQLGFDIESMTLENIKLLKEQINTIAIERITNEFEKFFSGKFIEKGIHYIRETSIHEQLPVFKDNPELIHKLPSNITPLKSFGEVIALFNYLLKETTTVHDIIKQWKCSNQIKKEAQYLIKSIQYYEKNDIDSWLIYQLPYNYFKGFIRMVQNLFPDNQISFQVLDHIYQSLPIKSKTDLAINGQDLLTMFPHLKKGPWIHQMLEKIEKNVVLKKLSNTKEEIKEWISCHPPAIS